jgi:hypothetical protein
VDLPEPGAPVRTMRSTWPFYNRRTRFSISAVPGEDDTMNEAAATTPGKGLDNWVFLAIACAVFVVVCFAVAWFSTGFLEADGIIHSIRRRFALSHWVYFVDVWTRPLCVMVSAIWFWALNREPVRAAKTEPLLAIK